MSDAAREAILSRVRQALRSPAPEPHWLRQPASTGPVFPIPEATESACRDRFRREFAAIQGEWIEADSLEEGRPRIKDWLFREEIATVLVADNPLLRGIFDGFPQVRFVGGDNASISGWDAVDMGVTPCESLVAESGTIAVSAGLSGRALSVLPPIHMVVATADQLVPDLESSFAKIRARYGEELPSTLTWISGPSRTADIEKILVLGAHGPRRLVLLMLPSGTA